MQVVNEVLFFILSMSGPAFLAVCVSCIVVGSVAFGYSVAEYRRSKRDEFYRFADAVAPAYYVVKK